MNPYVVVAAGTSMSMAKSLASRLAAWHDAMVNHERKLRTGWSDHLCDEQCPHVEARSLWGEALGVFGERAHQLTFLRSRALREADT
jgi:hypothetical protein